jgi:hypothetical protein
MKRSLAILTLFAGLFAYSACGDKGKNTTPATDTSTDMGPAPDNNSANNPSLADTAYEKNRTRPITDTMKKK